MMQHCSESRVHLGLFAYDDDVEKNYFTFRSYMQTTLLGCLQYTPAKIYK